jgi:hypothetical protein
LWPIVQGGLPEDDRFGGALTNTFLLALATPMIVLPIERIFKPSNPRAAQAGDDRQLDVRLARDVENVLGPESTFGAAPFAATGGWSYVGGYPPFNIAKPWPEDLLRALGAPDAFYNADSALARRVVCNLRNALAHGGVAYLDEDGRQTDSLAAMMAFAGAIKDRQGRLIGLNILRIGCEDFYSFLMAWADWLGQPRVRGALNRVDPLAVATIGV